MTSSKSLALVAGLLAAGVLAGTFFLFLRPGLGGFDAAGIRDYNEFLARAIGPGEGGAPWGLQPGFDGGDRLRVDSLGLRSRELSPKKSLPRILILGDSFAFGYGLPEGEPFAHVLQKRLEGKAEVANAGVSGFEIQDSAKQFFRVVDRVDPDLVFVTFVVNDLDDSRAFDAAGRYVRAPHLSELPEGFFTSSTNIQRIASLSGMSGELFIRFLQQFPGGDHLLALGVGPYARSRWARFASELGRIHGEVARRGARLALFAYQPPEAGANARLLEVCGPLGIPVFGTDPAIPLGTSEYRLDWDPHPNAKAHAHFADRLLGAIAQAGVVPGIGVPPLEPLVATPALEQAWKSDYAAIVRNGLHPEVVFLPESRRSNLQQAIAGFENASGLLGARAVVLLHSARPFRKLRLTASLDSPGEAAAARELEVRLGGSPEALRISVGKEALETDLDVDPALVEAIEQGTTSYLLEVDVRDPIVIAAAPQERARALGVRIRRIEVY